MLAASAGLEPQTHACHALKQLGKQLLANASTFIGRMPVALGLNNRMVVTDGTRLRHLQTC